MDRILAGAGRPIDVTNMVSPPWDKGEGRRGDREQHENRRAHEAQLELHA